MIHALALVIHEAKSVPYPYTPPPQNPTQGVLFRSVLRLQSRLDTVLGGSWWMCSHHDTTTGPVRKYRTHGVLFFGVCFSRVLHRVFFLFVWYIFDLLLETFSISAVLQQRVYYYSAHTTACRNVAIFLCLTHWYHRCTCTSILHTPQYYIEVW